MRNVEKSKYTSNSEISRRQTAASFLPIQQHLTVQSPPPVTSPPSMVVDLVNLNLILVPIHSKSRPKLESFYSTLCHVNRTFPTTRNRRMVLSVRNTADDNRLNSDGGSGTRLVRTIQAFQLKLITRLKNLTSNLPLKIFSLLVGFYCATAFATVIGQTGDWDVLSAALTVAVVEAIGALMYKPSLPLVHSRRNLIVIVNYWKAGLSLGLFLDSFKY